MPNNYKTECSFCDLDISSSPYILLINDVSYSLEDKFPIVKGHTLIVTKRHIPSFFDLSSYEKNQCVLMVDDVRKYWLQIDKTITGFNVGFNDGVDAGQTIFHCHIHVIPRRKQDVLDPTGGIRNIIPGKGRYY